MNHTQEQRQEQGQAQGQAQGQVQAQVQNLHLQNGHTQAHTIEDMLAQEVPVALVYNGIAHAVMLASPLDLADFAHGFSLSERIITRTEEIYDLELMPPGEHGIEIHLHIAAAAFARLKQHRRTLAGPSGCGLCGTESLTAMDWHLPPITSDIQLSLPSLLAAAHSLQQRQVLNAATGALHAAAWVNPQGQILLLREDVGRHNALDKLIGALALLQKHTHTVREPGFVLLTSRASYELVQKAARANIPLLATISAPTSLAVRMAQQTGLTLLGFVREQRAVIYAHGQRVIMTGHAEGAEGAEGAESAESADDTYRA